MIEKKDKGVIKNSIYAKETQKIKVVHTFIEHLTHVRRG
jgi:hypothetical protein